MLKIIWRTFLCILLSSLAFAGEKISYSGRLVQATGAPVAGPVNLTFKIYDDVVLKCTKAINSVALVNGVFNTEIDFGVPECGVTLSNVITTAVGASHDISIQVIDNSNGKTYPKQRISTVPLALYAMNGSSSASIADGSLTDTKFSGISSSCANGEVLVTNGLGSFSCGTIASSVTSVNTLTGAVTLTTTNIAEGTNQYFTNARAQSALTASLATKQDSDATLTALSAYSTDGILVHTGVDTFTARTLLGTSSRVSVTNGNGVSGNPTINIDALLLPSPLGGDSGKFLKATGADTSAWTTFGSSDVTTALGFTPLNKAGDTVTSGVFDFSGGSAMLRVSNPILLTDVANKQYVDSTVTTASNSWTASGSDVYRLAGNVGIGTTAPGSTLEIKGAGTTSITSALNVTDSAGSSKLYIRNDGNVGIGTASPTSKLYIASGSLMVDAYTTSNAGIFFRPTYNNSGFYNLSIMPYDHNVDGNKDGLSINGWDGVSVTTGANTRNERMRIDHNGNVGIGTNAPLTKLDVSGEIRTRGASAGYVGFEAAASTSSTTYTWPNTAGTNGYVLSTDGAGVLSWSAMPSAPVTSVNSLTGTVTLTTTNIAEGTNQYFTTTRAQAALTASLATKQDSDATLTALAAYSADGIVVHTGVDTFTGRTLLGTTSRVSVTNGDGVSGNPTVNIDALLLPSPLVGDSGKFLKATGADTSAWTTLASSDVTTALGFTPLNKAGDTVTSGAFDFSGGSAMLRVSNPILLTDVANKQYVDTAITTATSSWTASGSDVYRLAGNVGIGTSTPSAALDVRPSGVSGYFQVASSGIVNQVKLSTNSGGHFRFTNHIVPDLTATYSLGAITNYWNNFYTRYGYFSNEVAIGVSNALAPLDVNGEMRTRGATAGYVGFKAAASTSSTTYTWPTTAGTNGYILTTDGTGTLTWTAQTGGGSGAVSSVNAQTGTVTLTTTDIAEGSNEYFTTARAQAALTASLATKEPTLAAGTTAQYYRGDKSWQTLNTLNVPELTNLYFTNDRVLTATISAPTLTNSAIAAADTVQVALGKLQAQTNSQGSTKADLTNGVQVITAAAVTGLTAPVAGSDAANKQYVDTAITTASNSWTENGTSIYRLTGNVGVGTATPVTPIDISRSVAGSFVAATLQNTSSANTLKGVELHFKGVDTVGTSKHVARIISAAEDSNWVAGNLVFATRGTDVLAEQMRITGAGNVGIGTATPTAKLQVGSPVSFTASSSVLSVFGSDGTGTTSIAQFFGYRTATGPLHNKALEINQSGTYGGGILDVYGTSTGRVHFDPSGNSYVLSQNAGNFSIGTNVPTATLTVVGTASISGQTYFGGNVGIGTSVPSGTLEVSGVNDVGSVASVITNLSQLNTGKTVELGFRVADSAGTKKSTAIIRSIPGNIDSTTGAHLAFFTRKNDVSPTESMRIDNNGNVGIGTATPTYKLDVNGSLNATSLYIGGVPFNPNSVSSTVSAAGGQVNVVTQSATDAATASRSALVLQNNGTGGTNEYNLIGKNAAGTMTSYILQSGAASFAGLGIGTNTPSAQLGVNGSIAVGEGRASYPRLIFQNTGWLQKHFVGVHYQGDTFQMGANSQAVTATTANLANTAVGTFIQTLAPSYYSLQYGAAGGNPIALNTALYVNNSGAIGVGTSSPTAQFQVGGDMTNGRVYINGAASGASPLSTARPSVDNAQLIIGRQGDSEDSGGIEFLSSPAASGFGWKLNAPDYGSTDFRIFRRFNSATWSEAMRIQNSTGNVAIGTATATASKLTISDATAGNSRIQFQTGTTNGLLIGQDTSVDTVIWNPQAGYMRFGTAAVERMRILSNGYLGIGTIAPLAPLDVNGEIRTRGSSTGYVGFKAATTSASTTYTWPTTTGTSNYVLTTDGTGTLTWATPFAGLTSSNITTALGYTPVNKAGDTLTGSLTFTGSNFTISPTSFLIVPNPVNPTDAVNKQYVDSFGQWTASGTDIYRLTGNVGIGTTSPISPLHIVTVGSAATAVQDNAVKIQRTNTIADTGSKNALNITSSAVMPSGTLTSANGLLSIVNTGAGNLGTIATASALWARVDNNGGTITNAMGLNINDSAGTASVTNQYGVYVNTLTKGSALNYAIYTQGTTPSYFGGNVAVGGSSLNVGTMLFEERKSQNPYGVAVGISNSGDYGSMIFGRSNSTGAASGAVAFGISNSVATDGGIALGISNSTSGGGAIAIGKSVSNTTAGSLMIGPSNTAKITILSSGNVGIGATAPTATLTVAGTASISGQTYFGGNVGIGMPSPTYALEVAGSARFVSGGAGDVTLTHSAMVSTLKTVVGGQLALGASGTEAMRIKGSYVGIGTTNPLGLFDVVNGASTVGRFVLNGNIDSGGSFSPLTAWGTTTASQAGLAIGSNRSGGNRETNFVNFAPGYASAGFSFDTWDGTTYSTRMRILTNGNIGIGVLSPGVPLEVNGDVKATAFVSTSDQKLKKDIHPIEGLDLILGLKGKRFRWISSNEEDFGLIAQEVEKIIPQAVVTDKNTGLKSVKYSNLVAPLIEAVKQLKNENTQLEARLRSIEDLLKKESKRRIPQSQPHSKHKSRRGTK